MNTEKKYANDIRSKGEDLHLRLGVVGDRETNGANTQDVGESKHVAKENCISLSTVHEE